MSKEIEIIEGEIVDSEQLEKSYDRIIEATGIWEPYTSYEPEPNYKWVWIFNMCFYFNLINMFTLFGMTALSELTMNDFVIGGLGGWFITAPLGYIAYLKIRGADAAPWMKYIFWLGLTMAIIVTLIVLF